MAMVNERMLKFSTESFTLYQEELGYQQWPQENYEFRCFIDSMAFVYINDDIDR